MKLWELEEKNIMETSLIDGDLKKDALMDVSRRISGAMFEDETRWSIKDSSKSKRDQSSVRYSFLLHRKRLAYLAWLMVARSIIITSKNRESVKSRWRTESVFIMGPSLDISSIGKGPNLSSDPLIIAESDFQYLHKT